MKKFNNNSKVIGFTLIELLIVIAVIGVLSVGVLTALNVTSQIGKANLSKAKTFSASVENALAINQVGKWSFEEGQGNPSKDTSGYGNNGALSSPSPTWQDANTCGLGFGGCILFGANKYISIPDLDILSFVSGTSDKPFTISLWAKFNVVSGDQWMIEKGGPGVAANEYKVVLQNGIINFQLRQVVPAGRNAIRDTITTVTAGTWYHIVGVYAGTGGNNAHTGMKAYINGKREDGSGSTEAGYVSMSNTTSSLFIGAGNGAPIYCECIIDEVAIYSQAFLSSQIQQLYAQGLPRHTLAKK